MRARSRHRRALIAVGAGTVLAMVVAGCAPHHGRASGTKSASASLSPSTGLQVPDGAAPAGSKVSDTGPGAAPGVDVAFASDVYSVAPSGPLPKPATLTLTLAHPLATGSAVVIATRESATDPWSYLPATLMPDRAHVQFTTDHFSFFGALAIDLGQAAAAFKTDFLDGIDSGATSTNTPRPRCDNETAARRDGYSVTSSTTDTVYWCFGMAGGHRVLKVTNNRRYPLEAAHAGLDAEQNHIDWGSWAQLSRIGSGQKSIIAPGGIVTFNADLADGGTTRVSTEMDGLGQSLYALQVGVTTLVSILTRFGAGGAKAAEAADKLLTVQSCATSIGKGGGAVVSGCFSPADMLVAFGLKGLLLAPLMAVGAVISFFHSELNALVDQFNGHDKYQIALARVSPPLLGMPWAPDQVGFGTVAPTNVFNGGDPSGAFTINWDNWGGTTADGHGSALWIGPGQITAEGTDQPAQFRAYDLGTCQGHRVYLHLAVWFPQHDEVFDPAKNGEAFYKLCPS
jgi:hypothetical protein